MILTMPHYETSRMVLVDNGAVRLTDISYVDATNLHNQELYVKVDNVVKPMKVTGFNALMLMYTMAPTWLEGKPFVKWRKHSWVIHNIIGHPAMQLLAFCGLLRWAMYVHDITEPSPIGYM